MTCRLFVDEVGNGDLNGAAADPNIRYLSLTGIITKQRTHSNVIQPQLDALKASFFGCGAPTILHRREIVRREGAFACLHEPEVRHRFDQGILDLLARVPYIAITVTIDKKLHLEKYGVW